MTYERGRTSERAASLPPVLRRTGAGSALLVLLVAGSASSVSAQGGGVRWTPVVGVTDPLGALADAPILSSAFNVVTYGDFAPLPTVGLGAEARRPGIPVLVRLQASYAFAGESTGRWGCAPAADGGPVGCPSILILVPTDMSVGTATLDLIAPLSVGPVELRPLLGAGLVRYSFRWDPAPMGSFDLAPGRATNTRAAVHYGLGTSVAVGATRVGLEVTELRVRSEPRPAAPARTRRIGLALELRTGR